MTFARLLAQVRIGRFALEPPVFFQATNYVWTIRELLTVAMEVESAA
jgi:hypothetical protein